MVTFTSTATDNNFSGVAEIDGRFDYHHCQLLLFFRSTQTYQPTPVVNNKYHCLLLTPLSATMASCNCNSIIVNNSQAVTLFSVVQVNSCQLARKLCQCSRSITKCIITTKLLIKQTLSSTTSAEVATAAACLPSRSTLWVHSCRWSRKKCCRKID